MAHGDHIMVKRWRGLYYHHGIDMGDDTVIHLAGEPLRRKGAMVCRSSIKDFLQGGSKVVVKYDNSVSILAIEETAAKAEEFLNQNGYCLFRKNCEHFASYCKTGKGASEQVKFYVRLGAVMVLAGITTVSIIGTVGRSRGV